MSSRSELPPIDPFDDPNFKPPYRRLGDHVSISKIPNNVPPLPKNPTDNELEKTESWLKGICRDAVTVQKSKIVEGRQAVKVLLDSKWHQLICRRVILDRNNGYGVDLKDGRRCILLEMCGFDFYPEEFQ